MSKVARVLGPNTLAITMDGFAGAVGDERWVQNSAVAIVDPDTQESLGTFLSYAGPFEIICIYDAFAVLKAKSSMIVSTAGIEAGFAVYDTEPTA